MGIWKPESESDDGTALWHQLQDLGPQFAAYLLSFTMLGTFWLVFVGCKSPAENWLYAQNGKQIPGPSRGLHHLRQFLVLACQVEAVISPRSHIIEAVRLLTPVTEIMRRNDIKAITGGGGAEVLINHYEVVGLTKGQRLQQYRPHDCEK